MNHLIRELAYQIWQEKEMRGIPSTPEEDWAEAERRIHIKECAKWVLGNNGKGDM